MEAARSLHQAPDTAERLSDVWFSRVARAAVRKLGTCFWLSRCTYYACVMQSTAGLAEGARHPPCLCPVCLAKVSHLVVCKVQKGDEAGKEAYVREKYRAIADCCEAWAEADLFAGYQAWILERLKELE